MIRQILHRSRPYALSLVVIAGVTGLLLPFRAQLNSLNLVLIYLIVVTGLALRVNTWPGIVASLAAFLCFDFFFVPPYDTLSVAHLDQILALVVFLGLAILITQLIVRVRSRTAEALHHGRQTATLYQLSTTLIGELGMDAMLTAIVRRVEAMFSLDSCAILLLDHDRLVPRAVVGERLNFDDPNLTGLTAWVLQTRQLAGLGQSRGKLRPPRLGDGAPLWGFAQGRRDHQLLLLPIATDRQVLGVLVVTRRSRSGFDLEESQLLETFANQAAIALERNRLREEQTRAEVLARADELKTALLSAVSHDLRTPLATIKASATSLLQPEIEWPAAQRRELLQAINQEADRLNHLVANLLDLSRIEAGALRPAFAWYDLSEVLYAAVDRTAALLQDHQLMQDIAEDLPPLQIDFVEIEQVLVNLLENAAKYAPSGTRISLAVRRTTKRVEISVADEGSGIPAGEEERIFDKFYQVEAPDRPLGAGVGLAICRGFIEAHGGCIWAERNPERGLTIRFSLPVPPPELTAIPSPNGEEVRI
jgi:two-component system sensor histidine kinase KdpD